MTLTFVAASAAATAQAEQITCEQMAELAGAIMKNRQHGVEMMNTMKAAVGNSTIELMVEQAYSRPRFTTESYQDEAILDFKNDWYLSCYQARKES